MDMETARARCMCILSTSVAILLLSISVNLFRDNGPKESAPRPPLSTPQAEAPVAIAPAAPSVVANAPAAPSSPSLKPGHAFIHAYEEGLESSQAVYSECVSRLLRKPPADLLENFGDGRKMTLPDGNSIDLSDVYTAQFVYNVKAYDECFYALLATARDHTGRSLGYDMGPKKDHLAEMVKKEAESGQ